MVLTNNTEELDKPVVFMCGALRSGTTLIRLMLDQHPSITNSGEFDFLVEWDPSRTDDNNSQEYIDWLESDRIFKHSKLTANRSLDRVELARDFVRQVSQSDSTITLNIHRHFDRLPILFPNAKYIHLIRDPRDVARSSIGMGWSGNPYYGLDHWIDSEASWDRLSTMLDSKQYLEVRYEDVVMNPDKWLEEICYFLSLPYNESMLSYHENSSYKAPDTRLINQWHTKLSETDIKLIEWKAGDLMRSRRYEIVGSENYSPSAALLTRLWIENKLGRFAYSIKRFGILLPILERITRYVGLQKVSRRFRIQMDEIVNEQLR